MPVTEAATLPLVAGSNVLERGSQAAGIWQDMIATISQQEGFQYIYSGLQHESPNAAQMFIGWDTIESHERFQDLPCYQEMLKSLEPILDGSPQLVHFELESPSDLAAAVSAPVTEIATIVLLKKTESFDDNLSSFAKILDENAEGFRGCAHSWILEDVQHESLGAGVSGRACIMAIGWSSISAHLAFKGTSAFQKGLELLSDARGSEIHHTIFSEA